MARVEKKMNQNLFMGEKRLRTNSKVINDCVMCVRRERPNKDLITRLFAPSGGSFGGSVNNFTIFCYRGLNEERND